MLNIILFEIKESVRNRWLGFYGLTYAIFMALIIYGGVDKPLQTASSIISLVLLLIPLFSLFYGAINFAESQPFFELMLTKPLSRNTLYCGKLLGQWLSLSVSYVTGMLAGIALFPFYFLSLIKSMVPVLVLGIFLHLLFLALALSIANIIRKKEVLIAIMLLLWFYFYILFDLILLSLAALLGHYPLEGLLFTLIAFNPIDLMRIALLMQADMSSLLNFSGSLFDKFLGKEIGIASVLVLMIIWAFSLMIAGLSLFKKKDV